MDNLTKTNLMLVSFFLQTHSELDNLFQDKVAFNLE